jgi:hypothetical protein
MLGGKLPEVAEQRSLDENSWRSLLLVLEEENRSAEHLPEQYGVWSRRIPTLLNSCNRVTKKKRNTALK